MQSFEIVPESTPSTEAPTLRSVKAALPTASEHAPEGKKYDAGKPRTDLLPCGALQALRPHWPSCADVSDIFSRYLAWKTSPVWDRSTELVVLAATVLVVCEIEAGGEVRHEDAGFACPRALVQVAKVLAFGASKYGPNNWQRVEPFTDRYVAAMLRHVLAFAAGDETDEESGLPHLAHASCCALFLVSDAVGHDAT